MPLWVADFVLMDVGTGIVVGVPGHDTRDFDFAKKYKLPIVRVVVGSDGDKSEIIKREQVQEEEGTIINSGFLNGLDIHKATKKIMNYLVKKGWGKTSFRYKLHDWLISRQRYWGTPIPIVYCDKCGIVPISEKNLPVKLPKDIKFGKGNPLTTNKKWLSVKCPKCKGEARRETDTLDTFVNSSWYYLRYTNPRNSKKIFDSKKANYWAPVDQYIGGPEHITMHLIYMRFYTKFLRDLELIKFDEPALKYFTQGIVHGSDGERMSKSRGNVIEPFGMIRKYGADTLRLALVSFASPDKDSLWNEKIVLGSHKFLKRVFDYFSSFKKAKSNLRIESKLNKTIKEVTDYVNNFKHNLAIIKIRQLFDSFIEEGIDKQTAEKFLKLLHIYCPYITEELWEKLGNKGFISLAEWPEFDERKINDRFDKEDKAKNKLVSDIASILKIIKQKKKNVYVYVIPNELSLYDEKEIGKRTGKIVNIFSVSDKKKYDPTNKSKNSKPGKPAIFLE